MLAEKRTASSPESVGAFWFGEATGGVIQCDLSGFEGPEAVGFSGGQFCFVVQTLDGTRGKGAFGPEPDPSADPGAKAGGGRPPPFPFLISPAVAPKR